MSNTYTGGCLCGAVRYEASTAPMRCMICHCQQCRRHSGAPCLSFVHFSTDGFVWLGNEPRRYRSSPYAERGFCGTCGSTVSMHEEVLADRVQIAVGSLDEPGRVTPDDQVWTKSRIAWFEIDDDLPRFDESSAAVPSKAGSGGGRAEFAVIRGFEAAARPEAARLFWHAFAGKLERIMGPEAKALRFFEAVIDPNYAFSAVTADGRLLGIAGFKTADGAFAGGTLADLAACYGWAGAVWRGILLELLERATEPDKLLMDGIFVREEARGMGVGSALLDAIRREATGRGLAEVRLDVIDENPRARALYERKGFRATAAVRTGVLKYLYGFSGATTMVLRQDGVETDTGRR